MGAVKLTKVWNKQTRQVDFKLTVEGANRALFFTPEQLSELRDIIRLVQEDLNHDPSTR